MKNKNLTSFNQFAEEIFAAIDSPSKTLLEAMKYSFFSGGKRIRAQFVYTLGDILNIAKIDCHRIAFAIEAIHTYSLIHDDLPAMDNDDLRRGKPTCHIKFNEATAILAGDALQTLAFEVLQDINVASTKQLINLNKLLANCSGISGMVGGQQLDIEGEREKLSLDKLELIHLNKTAKMFKASILMPYTLCSNQSSEVEELLSKLSLLVGLCFQIKDDILDVTKTTEQLGKTSAKDINAEKSTYVSLMGLENSIEYLDYKKTELTSILNRLKNLGVCSNNLSNLIKLVIDRNY